MPSASLKVVYGVNRHTVLISLIFERLKIGVFTNLALGAESAVGFDALSS
jgi:hypothetical protein